MAVSRRDAPTPPSAPPASSGGGLEISTLVITALASAGAAIVSSRLFGAGTLVSAALTPVVIAVLKEALDRPRRVVAEAVPVAVALPRRRLRVRDAGASGPDPTGRGPAGARPRGRAGGDAGTLAPYPDDLTPPEPRGDEEIHVYRSTRRRWRLAIVTGLLGFLLAAVVLTVTELAAGGAVGRDSRATTYFGGSERSAPQDDTQTTPREQDPEGGTSTTPRDTETTPQDAPSVPDDPAATGPTTPAPAPGETAPGATPSTPAPETPAPTPAPTPTPTPAPAPAPGGEATPPAAP